MNCAGSVAAGHGLPNVGSIYAAEGTAAHTLYEDCLLLGMDPSAFVGHKLHADGHDFEVTDDMARDLQPGIDRVRELGGEMYIETLVDTSQWCGKGNYGYLDVGLISPSLIVINDLKYGMGEPVSPVDNEQLMLYALGFWWNIARHKTKATEFLIIIDMPRIPGSGGEWRVSLDDLLAFGEKVKIAAHATTLPNAPLHAGEKQCRWCPVKDQPGGCVEHDRFNLATMSLLFEDLDADGVPVLIEKLTPERRSYVVLHSSMLRTWLDRQHESALHDALSGQPTPGLKAVAGRRPPRKWTDEVEVEEMLRSLELEHSEVFKYSLISPTEASKRFKAKPEIWAACQPFVDAGEAKPVLVPADDEREALTPITDKFD